MKRIISSLFFVLTYLLAFTAIAGQTSIPGEAAITGKDQGAVTDIRSTVADVRAIEGLKFNTNGTALNITQSIIDLNAEVTKSGILIKLSSDVLFDFDKSSIKPEAEAELQKVALIIKEKAKGMVGIYGYTDAEGSEEYNQALSLRRAMSVHSWLTENNVRADYKIEGLGETKPIARNTNPDGTDNPEGRALNRRVEIEIQTTKQK